MNVNELSKQLLDVYRRLDVFPADAAMPERLCEIFVRVATAAEQYRSTRERGLPLIFGTCAMRQEDCEFWEECSTVCSACRPELCRPEGLAFCLADVVMYTLAAMQELGIDIDAVVTAEYNYLATHAKSNGIKSRGKNKKDSRKTRQNSITAVQEATQTQALFL